MVVTSDTAQQSPADALGAGDAFTAAWIFGRLQRWPLRRQGTLANRVGALVASRPGAMPLLKDEFARLIAQDESIAPGFTQGESHFN